MTPDELPSQPRKASWKRWSVVLAGVLGSVLAVLFLQAPAPELVSLRFLGSTRHEDFKTLTFKGTNGLSTMVRYSAGVYLTSLPARQAKSGASVYHYRVTGIAQQGKTFYFVLDAPLSGTNWSVEWTYLDAGRARTLRERLRQGCYDFLTKHGMFIVAEPFNISPRAHYIPASELKEQPLSSAVE